jgi:hypothetical protein
MAGITASFVTRFVRALTYEPAFTRRIGSADFVDLGLGVGVGMARVRDRTRTQRGWRRASGPRSERATR